VATVLEVEAVEDDEVEFVLVVIVVVALPLEPAEEVGLLAMLPPVPEMKVAPALPPVPEVNVAAALPPTPEVNVAPRLPPTPSVKVAVADEVTLPTMLPTTLSAEARLMPAKRLIVDGFMLKIRAVKPSEARSA
jgi:hypothetical protein